MMKSADIRQLFLEYFAQLGHQVVASGSLVPGNDPTLLFTNAGMVQFKETFLGSQQRNYQRAVTAQRCVRAGGKHNDLDNVGYTARHHTFFEMLGNFSFGDYFKREAIGYAWRFLTETLQLPPQRLWVTIHHQDDEAQSIWLNEIGVDPARLSRLGDESNFWSMGDTGPCGPCSEIFYDHGPQVPGGPPGSADDDKDRYIEIWNLVFMQYEQHSDGSRTPLPRPSVDTGMGLERIAAVMQQVHSNYEIDLFQALIRAAAQVLECADLQHSSLRVIADHIRSSVFLLVDGVLPANEGRGYVLRRIIRRAVRHGHHLGQQQPFLYRLVPALVEQMGSAYPELACAAAAAAQALQAEEEQFAHTLDIGMRLLQQAIAQRQSDTLPGELVFKLYDTYGFPADLTADVAREQGLVIDEAGFEQAMAEQKHRARAASKFKPSQLSQMGVENKTLFEGYQALTGEAQVVALFQDNQRVEALLPGQQGLVLLDRTVFYAESGGQVGDSGELVSDQARFFVVDCIKQGDSYWHQGQVSEQSASPLCLGDRVMLYLDAARRQQITQHHSATHLLHAALKQVVEDSVYQKGSLVDSERLRFDFAYVQPLTPSQLVAVERCVNQQIQANVATQIENMPLEQAKAQGAAALFGEKYADQVRGLTLGQQRFSVELCGGTHVQRTGDIGVFKIISESGVAAGVRRIEAVAGQAALRHIEQQDQQRLLLAQLLKSSPDQLYERVEQLLCSQRELEKNLEHLKQSHAQHQVHRLLAEVSSINGCALIVQRVDGVDAKALRYVVDQLKSQLHTAVIVLFASVESLRVQIAVGVTANRVDQIKAGDIARTAAPWVGGQGGGKAEFAMAGGKDSTQIDAAMQQIQQWVLQRLR